MTSPYPRPDGTDGDAGPAGSEAGAQDQLVAGPRGRVAQVLVGPVQQLDDACGRRWSSGIRTTAVTSPVWVGPNGLAGDEQADRVHHGGGDKAVFVHPCDHYPRWRAELDSPAIGPGAFGENLVVAGLDEQQTCVGDVVRIGSFQAQVSQPRRPCWKPARRFGVVDLPIRIETTGRTGWYLRVREPGTVRAYDVIVLVDRPRPEWTVARASAVIRDAPADLPAVAALSEVPELAESWRADLRRTLARAAARLAR